MLSKKSELEYRAVREATGWFKLDAESTFEMSGKDAVSFLQGMVSNDVKSLKDGEGCYAACLTPTGKMLSDLRIYGLSNRLLILLPKKEKTKILSHLDQFIFTEEVLFKDLEQETELFSLQGPISEKHLSDLGGKAPECELHRHGTFQAGGISIHAFAATHTGEKGFDLLVSKKDVPRFMEMLQASSQWEIGEATQEILRIEAGIPRYGIDMDESTLPLEAGLERAISYNKGCYVGQEVIARIKYIGHTNRILVGLTLTGPSSKGDKILHQEETVGTVTSPCYSPKVESFIALAMVRREMAKKELPLTVQTGEGPSKAIVSPLPFYAR